MLYQTKLNDTPNAESLTSFRIKSSEIPKRFLAACKKHNTWLQKNKFAGARVYLLRDPRKETRVVILYRHQSGRVLLASQYMNDRYQGVRHVCTAFSAMENGTFAATTNSEEEQFPTDSIRVSQFIGAGIGDLLRRHQANFELKSATPIGDSATGEQVYLAFLEESKEHLIEEGVFGDQYAPTANSTTPSDPALDGDTAKPVADHESTDGGNPYRAADGFDAESFVTEESISETSGVVINEQHRKVLDQLDSNQTSSGFSFALLIGSIVLFIAIGGFAWDWRFVLLLIPILLFHELGHFVAMRIFNYRNVKMFFIPLLGAAVSGSNFNVEGWKKCLVSLAGPLPGLMLAIPLAFATLFFDSELLRYSTWILVVLNLFNLLPILPLDGGWVMHALYFCRSPWLDASFRILAAIGLVGLAFLLGSKILGFIGAAMLFALPAVFSNSKIANLLKKRGVETASGDAQSIPVSTAVQIIDEMPKAASGNSTKLQATQVQGIYELLNTKPPKAGATIGLTLLYLASWVFGGIALLVLGAGFFADRVAKELFPEFDSGTIAISSNDFQRANQLDSLSSLENTSQLIAKFSNEQAASESFTFLKDKGIPVLAFDGILITTHDRRDEFLNAEEGVKLLCEQFVTGDQTGISIQIECTAPPELSEQIQSDLVLLSRYGKDAGLVMPWDPAIELTEQQLKARSVVGRLLRIESRLHEDPTIKQLSERNLELSSNDSTPEEMRKANEEYNAAYKKRRREILDEAIQGETVDESAANHYLAFEKFNVEEDLGDEQYDQREQEIQNWNSQLGQMLGQLPTTDGDIGTISPSDFRHSMSWAQVSEDEQTIYIKMIYFDQLIEGLPAMVGWLEQQGCTEIQLRIGDTISLLKDQWREAVE